MSVNHITACWRVLAAALTTLLSFWPTKRTRPEPDACSGPEPPEDSQRHQRFHQWGMSVCSVGIFPTSYHHLYCLQPLKVSPLHIGGVFSHKRSLLCSVFSQSFFVFSHESSVIQTFGERSHSWWAWKRWYQRWPPQIRPDLRATPSPMIELNTRASMVEGLCLKSRDTCF